MEDLLAERAPAGRTGRRTLIDPLLRAADALRRHVEGDGEPASELIAELAAAHAPAAEPVVEPAIEPFRRRAPAPPSESRSIRVPAEKIDTLLDLVGETVLHRRRLEHELGAGARRRPPPRLRRARHAASACSTALKDAAIGMRTLPLSSIVTPLPRAVRDLAAETGKEVELIVEGAETELDRAILEGPLRAARAPAPQRDRARDRGAAGA